MEKRFILAIFLIILILVIFNLKGVSPPPPAEKISEEEIQKRIEASLGEAVYEPASLEGLPVIFHLYDAVISSAGGVRSCRLKEYKTRDAGVPQLNEQLKKEEQRFRQQAKGYGATPDSPLLYSIKKLRFQLSHLRQSGKDEGVELISFSELYNGSLPPFLKLSDKDNKLIWAEGENYKIASREADKICLVQEIPDVGTITKEFVFNPELYLVDVKITLENTSPTASQPYELIITSGPDIGISEGIRVFTHLGPVALINNQVKKQQFGKASRNKTVEKTEYGQVGWVALQDKYFAKILIPNGKVRGAYISKNEHEEYTVGLKTNVPALQPSQKSEFSFGFYMGPKKLEDLYKAGRNTTKVVDYGLFGNLFRIVHVLKFFYRLTHNYGVSIILLTVLINLILLPLSLKSFKSMKEMRKLQPEMEKIRKEFKNDPQKMNAEVMELYRRHKVNPAGGCLPMLLQLPIFIGLFMTLRSVVELRGASFVLWIKDLSLPDALPLPFTVPYLGSSINILPLVMTAVTFLQQKVSGAGDSSARGMMLLFPLMMLFIFYNFPSGLVLYFLCSNLMNILIQIWINRPQLKKA